VESGLGIPLFCGDVIQQVILFLSAEATPLARAFEIWRPDADGELRCEQAYYSPELVAFGATRQGTSSTGQDLVSRVFRSALPFAVSTQTRAYTELEAVREAGIDIAVGLPIHDGRALRSVVLMFT